LTRAISLRVWASAENGEWRGLRSGEPVATSTFIYTFTSLSLDLPVTLHCRVKCKHLFKQSSDMETFQIRKYSHAHLPQSVWSAFCQLRARDPKIQHSGFVRLSRHLKHSFDTSGAKALMERSW